MGILAKYTFNGDANDKVGSANGTVTNGSYTPGINNRALQFPATNNGYCQMGANFNFTTQNFTFSFLWYCFSWTTSTAGQTPVIISKGFYNTHGYYLQIASTFYMFVTNQSGAAQATYNNSSISLNTWHYIVITREGSSIVAYFNGSSSNCTPGAHINPTSSPYNFYINAYPAPQIMGNEKYDEFIIEQRKWIASEVKNKYSYYKGFF